ncbi:shikimate kinase [Microbacterium sp.]|uniref:shikimate kinase n=1 Tax=Microbacterium sp. TaxID=51671 RepID=UPI0028121333|nr:shikimate kinase [Microbacterium sp.]
MTSPSDVQPAAAPPGRGGEKAVVLVGPMGAGKTSIGRKLAKALAATFRDTDAIVVREHGPIPELFRTRGEQTFRELERRAVVEALAAGGVVSLGGGAVLDARTREDLREHRVVFLTVALPAVRGRIAGANRPLLEGADPVAEWRRIFDERRPLYEEVAGLEIDTSTGPISGVVARIADWVGQSAEEGSR